MQKRLHIFIVAFLLGFFSPLAFAYSQNDDDYSSYYNDSNDSYQPRNENLSYNDYNDDSYDDSYSPKYANNNSDYYDDPYNEEHHYRSKHHSRSSYSSKRTTSRLASSISPPGEKVVIVDPRVHRWGAYDAQGNLVREGMTSAGSGWCRDLHRSCHTSVGTFRINSLGDSSCVSRKFPLGRGGAPMPYCMYFNRNQALHGSYEVADANISHGCVRMHVDDAEWLRYNFVHIGTKVIIKPYY